MKFMDKRNYRLQTISPVGPLDKPLKMRFTDKHGLTWKWALIGASLVTTGLYLSSCGPKSERYTEVEGVRVRVSPNKPLKEPRGVMIDRVATEVGIHPSLAFALIKAESKFNPNALSETNAVGLTQVLRSTAKSECGITSLSQLADEEINVRCGLSYLKKLKSFHGTWEKALFAYNAGGKYVNKPPVKTVIYTRAILTDFINSLG